MAHGRGQRHCAGPHSLRPRQGSAAQCQWPTKEMIRSGSRIRLERGAQRSSVGSFRLGLPIRPMPPVALDIGGYKALRLANVVRISSLDADNRPTANSYALHEPSLRIIVVDGIMLG